ncbi:alpha-amylase family glycosyl hydrolase [Desulfonatronum parangueonense]
MNTRKKKKRKTDRRYPFGAESLVNGVHFRVWAPSRSVVTLVVESDGNADGREPFEVKLEPEDNGYFSVTAPDLSQGALYRFRLDDDPRPYPDPASRFQPNGPHGPSQIVDPALFAWTDDDWPGVSPQGQVIYEMHVGTFTQEGTWTAAVRELPELAKLGVTVLEVMPVADFPGRFGWGYDGVNLYAPTRLYGTPDDFRLFVDKAHELNLGVILDVVYNHLGPDGNYLWQFSSDYFSTRHTGEWGEPLNFDETNAGPVREYVLANAAYWIEEFHLDGLRMDATQQVFDDSDEHILAALTRRVREAGAPRKIFIVGENEPQLTRMLLPVDEGGYGHYGLVER